MKKRTIFPYVLFFLIFGLSVPVIAGEWLGSNLILNGSFDSGWQDWTNVSGNNNWDLSSGQAEVGGGLQARARQVVNVLSGKRYRISGSGYSFYKSTSVGSGRGYIWVSASGIAKTPTWEGKIYSGSYPNGYKEAEGISNTTSTTIELYWNDIRVSGIFWGGLDYVNLNQIVYDPQLDISEDSVISEITTVGLTLNDLSYADNPTNWWVDWGDGTIDYNPTLNSISQHTYDISSGITNYVATFYGENQAGNMMDTVAITIIPEPCTVSLLALGAILAGRKRRTV